MILVSNGRIHDTNFEKKDFTKFSEANKMNEKVGRYKHADTYTQT